MSSPLEPLRDWIDFALSCLKWPAAVAGLLLLPSVGLAMLNLLGRISQHLGPAIYFIGGAAAYLLLWLALLRRSRWTFFLTLEHELTHVVFAWLTLHRVTNLRATARGGGSMRFVGQGNWLITVAPYFFPLTSTVLMLIFWVAPAEYGNLGAVLIGASFTYHVTSKLHQTHAGQSDLRQAGWVFSLMFLPASGLLFTGLVLAAALSPPGGRSYLPEFTRDLAAITRALYFSADERGSADE